MAIHIYQTDDGHVPGLEYMPCGTIIPRMGQALAMSGGVLTVASGTTKPTYLSMCEKESACEAGDIIPVIRVEPGTVYETGFSAAAGSVNVGDKVTLSADGTQVTATTAGGVAEIVYKDGTAAGSMCRVRF